MPLEFNENTSKFKLEAIFIIWSSCIHTAAVAIASAVVALSAITLTAGLIFALKPVLGLKM